MEWFETVLVIAIGLVVLIPLIVKLVKLVKTAINNGDWTKLLGLVIKLIEQAEKEFADGASRKEFVLRMVEASAEFAECDVSIDDISKLIDAIVALTKIVNK